MGPWTITKKGDCMKIDIFNHIFPKAYFDKMVAGTAEREGHAQARARYTLYR